MRRVLIVCDGLPTGGGERQMALVARSLPEEYDVRVSSFGDGPYAEVLRGSGVMLRVDPRRWRYDLSPAFRLWREILRWRPDVVHSWGWMSTATSMVACKILGIPLVDETITSGRPPVRWTRANRFLVSRSDAVIAISHAGLAAYDLRRPGAFVVHAGFEADRVPGDCIGQTRERDAAPEVVMVARMFREKDFDTLISAAELLHKEGRRVRFTLMGWGPERERLTARCQELTDAGVMRILDCGLEIMPVLAAADIGVLLTDSHYHEEGLSNSIMDYMACGLPVVCTDSGGNREVVIERGTGLLVPPCDPAAVADALRLLLDDREMSTRLGKAGRERIREEFSAEKMIDKTTAVYESAIGERAARRSGRPKRGSSSRETRRST